MGSRSRRRASLFGAIAGGVVLTMVSAAFACTSYYGKMTVTAVNVPGAGGSGSHVSEGPGSGLHEYCVNGSQTQTPVTGTVSIRGPFTLLIEPASSCTVNKLPAATYQVRWSLTTVPTNTVTPPSWCNPTAFGGSVLGTITVNNSGHSLNESGVQGARTYVLPPVLGEVHICAVQNLSNPSAEAAPEVFLNIV